MAGDKGDEEPWKKKRMERQKCYFALHASFAHFAPTSRSNSHDTIQVISLSFHNTWSLYKATLRYSASTHRRIHYLSMGDTPSVCTAYSFINKSGALSTITLRPDNC